MEISKDNLGELTSKKLRADDEKDQGEKTEQERNSDRDRRVCTLCFCMAASMSELSQNIYLSQSF